MDPPSSVDYPPDGTSDLSGSFLQDAAPILVQPLHENVMSSAQTEHVRTALSHLRKAHVTPLRLLQMILASDNTDKQFFPLKTAFYRKDNEHSVHQLLNTISGTTNGHSSLESWIQGDGCDVVRSIIHREMEAAKPLLAMTSSVTTPDFMNTWSINAIMDPVDKVSPFWTSILSAATDADATKLDIPEGSTNPRVIVCLSLYFDNIFSLLSRTDTPND